jgi:hypothetical protein
VLDLTVALVGPIAKLLLKSWLGDTGSEIGWNILEIAKKRFDDRRKAFEAQQRAARVAELVVQDMASGLAVERSREEDVLAAAYELCTDAFARFTSLPAPKPAIKGPSG